MKPEGVWLPVITPFVHHEIDYDAYDRLIHYYLSTGISGLIPLGTTGECPVISEYEFEKVIAKTMKIVQDKVPVFVGTGGNDTRKVVKTIKTVEKYPVAGILSVCPYYSRPGQDGIFSHFSAISQNLKRLEKKQLILKQEDPHNVSRSIVKLTSKGKTAYYAHRHWHETMDGGFKAYFIKLDQDRIDFLIEFMSRVEDFLKRTLQ